MSLPPNCSCNKHEGYPLKHRRTFFKEEEGFFACITNAHGACIGRGEDKNNFLLFFLPASLALNTRLSCSIWSRAAAPAHLLTFGPAHLTFRPKIQIILVDSVISGCWSLPPKRFRIAPARLAYNCCYQKGPDKQLLTDSPPLSLFLHCTTTCLPSPLFKRQEL